MCSLVSTFLGINPKFANNTYGVIIILISIASRIFIVSIAWSYGVFLVALKKTYPDSFYSELGWIAGLAQGFGSIVSPFYIWIVNRAGFRFTFLAGITLCFLSMLASSFTTSEHHLFFTYSLPFGIGSSVIFVLESLLVGIYFPSTSRYHVSASVAISLGFPLGFLILTPLTDALIKYFNNDWRLVQRLYGFMTLFQLLVFTPFFTEKHADKTRNTDISGVSSWTSRPASGNNTYRAWTALWFLSAEQVKWVCKILWVVALFCISFANNSVQINLNGFFESTGLDAVNQSPYFIAIGISDVFFRLLLAACGYKLMNNLVFCYLAASIAGLFISLVWKTNMSHSLNILICLIYGLSPAVTMSLMYSINTEINGTDSNIEQYYTINVMISGFGIFFGPIISGLILDVTKQDYSSVFLMTSFIYILAGACFLLLKIVLIGNSKNKKKQEDYEGFENNDALGLY